MPSSFSSAAKMPRYSPLCTVTALSGSGTAGADPSEAFAGPLSPLFSSASASAAVDTIAIVGAPCSS